ncbi:DUF1194 domain-containing protein [Pseudooceanicola sp.]|uniref:DUF1194 domain-containing protein n=1 Tax=Pseudooceanicola sp. TaxID=1914328 RepID=UPI00261B76EA|nr:DUF1194 domain-containing protein [Pseudooceanicola sp.]MDF1853988.1 DUF1194 domain-containing protein [Pseudooceanicola sp.]
MMRKLIGTALALWLGLGAAALAECRLALVLALDVSGSVSGTEYRLQLDGVANALMNPEVSEAILAIPGATVGLTVFEWSGPRFQRVLVDWSDLATAEDILRVAATLRATKRSPTEPSTAIGNAMAFAAASLLNGPRCDREVIDISGDGKSNNGPNPRDVLLLPQVTINALAIGGELIDPAELRPVGLAELTAYFRAYVLRGPQAFVETAIGFSAFQEAMVRKLKRELQILAVSDAEPLRFAPLSPQ